MGKKEPRGPQRQFNFGLHACRPVALKVAYLGWEYSGLACSGGSVVDGEFVENSTGGVRTVEGALIAALVRARLIPGINECKWSRCGRTDKGVSGYSQVIGLYVRSNLGLGAQGTFRHWPGAASPQQEDASIIDGGADATTLAATAKEESSSSKTEFQYVQMLNSLLPPTIRVLAWSPVRPDFNARFNCIARRYNYTFSTLGLDLTAMREACALIVGEHDFRALCRIDKSNVPKTFVRRIFGCQIVESGAGWAVLDVHGSGFLYNQIRCIFAILHLVGRGLERPSIISFLLDPKESDKGRPTYQIADPHPLVLVDCTYPEGTFDWRTGAPDAPGLPGGTVTAKIIESLQAQYISLETRARQVKALMERVVSIGDSVPESTALITAILAPVEGITGSVLESSLVKVANEKGGSGYLPVAKRKRCELLEAIGQTPLTASGDAVNDGVSSMRRGPEAEVAITAASNDQREHKKPRLDPVPILPKPSPPLPSSPLISVQNSVVKVVSAPVPYTGSNMQSIHALPPQTTSSLKVIISQTISPTAVAPGPQKNPKKKRTCVLCKRSDCPRAHRTTSVCIERSNGNNSKAPITPVPIAPLIPITAAMQIDEESMISGSVSSAGSSRL